MTAISVYSFGPFTNQTWMIDGSNYADFKQRIPQIKQHWVSFFGWGDEAWQRE